MIASVHIVTSVKSHDGGFDTEWTTGDGDCGDESAGCVVEMRMTEDELKQILIICELLSEVDVDGNRVVTWHDVKICDMKADEVVGDVDDVIDEVRIGVVNVITILLDKGDAVQLIWRSEKFAE